MVKKRFISIITIITILIFGSNICFAESPYRGYNYSWGEEVPSPNAYLPYKEITGESLGIGSFNEPEDIFVDHKDNIYIVDTKNNRIIFCDSQFKVTKILKELKNGNSIETLKSPSSVFVDNNEMLITDKENARVIICDLEGNIKNILKKPETDLLKKDFNYLPRKVIKSSSGIIYVLPYNFYEGAFTYDKNGDFLGFFGSNKVEQTLGKLSDRFWKVFMTREQREKMRRLVPSAFESLDIDEQDFIYTATSSSMLRKEQLRKLNPKGRNIMEKPGFSTEDVIYGDQMTSFDESEDSLKSTAFVDVAVDDDGMVYGLDMERGRIFQYDQQSDLLSITGTIGDQVGGFRNPVAIDVLKDKLIVLDSRKMSITVFKETSYGQNIRKAVKLYRDGLYDEAIKPWKEIAKANCNLDLAYIGIGKSYYQNGNYREAMDYFKLGYDRESYSEAFKEYRKEFIRRNFPVIFIILSLLVALIIIITTRYTRKKSSSEDKYASTDIDKKYKLPFYTMLHPIDGFEQLKLKNAGSVKASFVILVLMLLGSVAKFKRTGFIFNMNRPEDFDILRTFSTTIIMFVAWVIANWGLCTLIEGKGRFREIWVASSYALVPNIMATYLTTFLSNYVIKDEGTFLSILSTIGSGWTLILLVIGMLVVHQFTFKKTLVSMLLSVVGIILMLFVYVLGYSLFSQVYMFCSSIFSEIMIRI